jgi:hypothetical protein
MTEQELLDYVLNGGSTSNTGAQGGVPGVPTWSVTSVPGLALSPSLSGQVGGSGTDPYQGLLPHPYGSDYSTTAATTGSQQPNLISYQALLDQLVSQRQQAARDLSAGKPSPGSSMPAPSITVTNL